VPRRARKDLDKIQDRRAEVVRLRGEGKTFDEIARLTGYSNGSAASKAWKAAIRQHPDQTVDEIRRQEKTRLEQIDATFSQVIARPPIKTTSIGRTQWDVRTCTCPVKAATNRDHEPDCQVQPVLDVGALISAANGRIKAGESLRKLVGADAIGPAPLIDARTQVIVANINQARARRGENPIRIPEPGPGTIPADQANAACDAALAALQPKAEILLNEAIDAAWSAAGQRPPHGTIQGQLED